MWLEIGAVIVVILIITFFILRYNRNSLFSRVEKQFLEISNLQTEADRQLVLYNDCETKPGFCSLGLRTELLSKIDAIRADVRNLYDLSSKFRGETHSINNLFIFSISGISEINAACDTYDTEIQRLSDRILDRQRIIKNNFGK